jgi:tetratricopeptide (TPR) repeat protein
VLALEGDVAQSIAAKVQVTLSGDERARLISSRQISPEVYENFLKGLSISEYSPAGVEKSIAYFQQAIADDPTFAPAYVALAGAYGELGTPGIGVAPPAEERPKMIRAIQEALELDPTLPEAHAIQADIYREEWQWSDAEREYKRLLDLNPNDARAHIAFSGWLLCQGRTKEALAWARRARELDPLDIGGDYIGWVLFHSHQYDEAIHELQSAVAVHPESASAQWFLGFALIANGQAEKAIPILEKAVSISERSPAIIGVLIRAYAHAGRRADALQLLAELKRRNRSGYVPTAAFVNAYLGLGDNEHAFVWLERAYREKSMIIQLLKVHPYFDPIREDPRFKDLLRRVGLA